MTHPLPPNKSAQGFTLNPGDGSQKAELIPTMMAGDGRPWDVGVDRAIANNLNALHDWRTNHQAPFMKAGGQFLSVFSGEWRVAHLGVLFFGTEHLSATVERRLIVAPQFCSGDGSACSLRITIARQLPSPAPSLNGANGTNAMFAGEFSSHTWTTSSTTMAVQADAALDLGVKDLQWGTAVICLEIDNYQTSFWGLSKCVEGPRRVATP